MNNNIDIEKIKNKIIPVIDIENLVDIINKKYKIIKSGLVKIELKEKGKEKYRIDLGYNYIFIYNKSNNIEIRIDKKVIKIKILKKNKDYLLDRILVYNYDKKENNKINGIIEKILTDIFNYSRV